MANEKEPKLNNQETARRWRHIGNWNRRIQIPGVWSGLVQDIPPNAVEELIKQGRKDFVPILQTSVLLSDADIDPEPEN